MFKYNVPPLVFVWISPPPWLEVTVGLRKEYHKGKVFFPHAWSLIILKNP